MLSTTHWLIHLIWSIILWATYFSYPHLQIVDDPPNPSLQGWRTHIPANSCHSHIIWGAAFDWGEGPSLPSSPGQSMTAWYENIIAQPPTSGQDNLCGPIHTAECPVGTGWRWTSETSPVVFTPWEARKSTPSIITCPSILIHKGTNLRHILRTRKLDWAEAKRQMGKLKFEANPALFPTILAGPFLQPPPPWPA